MSKREWVVCCGTVALMMALVSVPASAKTSFEKRCEMSQAIECVGFDREDDLKQINKPGLYTSWGLTKNGAGVIRGFLDKDVRASGDSALRFDILPGTGASSAGGWHRVWDREFKPGETFYVQYRLRVMPTMLSENFGGGGWKSSIIHQDGVTCGPIEIAVTNLYYSDRPVVYTDCGGQGMTIPGTGIPGKIPAQTPLKFPRADGTYEEFWLYDYATQQSEMGQGYLCHYQANKNKPDSCATYKPDQWMTFTFEVTIGEWGKPNSTVKVFLAYEGEKRKQFVHRTDYKLNNNGPTKLLSDGYNAITLTPYDTGKKPDVNHLPGSVWYDELIVSASPIPDPVDVQDDPIVPPGIVLSDGTLLPDAGVSCEVEMPDFSLYTCPRRVLSQAKTQLGYLSNTKKSIENRKAIYLRAVEKLNANPGKAYWARHVSNELSLLTLSVKGYAKKCEELKKIAATAQQQCTPRSGQSGSFQPTLTQPSPSGSSESSGATAVSPSSTTSTSSPTSSSR